MRVAHALRCSAMAHAGERAGAAALLRLHASPARRPPPAATGSHASRLMPTSCARSPSVGAARGGGGNVRCIPRPPAQAPYAGASGSEPAPVRLPAPNTNTNRWVWTPLANTAELQLASAKDGPVHSTGSSEADAPREPAHEAGTGLGPGGEYAGKHKHRHKTAERRIRRAGYTFDEVD